MRYYLVLRRLAQAALVVAIVLAPDSATAQWKWKGAAGLEAWQSNNIFRSPSALWVDGQRLTSDSLFHNDRIISPKLNIGIERSVGRRHALEVGIAASATRYHAFQYLNGGRQTVTMGYAYSPSKSVKLSLKLYGRQNRSVSTNVFGDELTRLFEYTQQHATSRIFWRLSRIHRLYVDYAWTYRNYTESPSLPSLDYTNHSAAIQWTRLKRRESRTDVRLRYRWRGYESYIARDEHGKQDEASPFRQFHYYEASLRYRRDLSHTVQARARVRGTYRKDPFRNYYTYRLLAAETNIRWKMLVGTEIELGGQWRRVSYPAREAPQRDSATVTPLRYGYLYWHVELERHFGRSFGAKAFVESQERQSGVTLETARTRRPYRSHQAGLALELDLDRLFTR